MLVKVVRTVRRGAVASIATLGMAACFLATTTHPPKASAHKAVGPDSTDAVGERKLARPTTPKDQKALVVYRAATRARGTKVLGSTEDRWLWLVKGRDTVMSVPVAVGMGESFSYNGRKWFFATPRGRRVVLSKVKDPVWTVPDWQYYEEAAGKDLDIVHVAPGQR